MKFCLTVCQPISSEIWQRREAITVLSGGSQHCQIWVTKSSKVFNFNLPFNLPQFSPGKFKDIHGGHGSGRTCDHINHFGHHIKEIWIFKAWGVWGEHCLLPNEELRKMTRASSQNVGKFYRRVKLSAKNLRFIYADYNWERYHFKFLDSYPTCNVQGVK